MAGVFESFVNATFSVDLSKIVMKTFWSENFLNQKLLNFVSFLLSYITYVLPPNWQEILLK